MNCKVTSVPGMKVDRIHEKTKSQTIAKREKGQVMGSKLSRQIGLLKNINLSVSLDLDGSEVNDKAMEKLSEVRGDGFDEK